MRGCRLQQRSPIAHLLLALGAGLLCLTMAEGARAQPQRILQVDHPGGLTRLRVGEPALVPIIDDDTLYWWYRPAGRFQFRTGPGVPVGGNPTRPGDENRALVSTAFADRNGYQGFTSRIQFSVNNTNPDAEGQLLDIYEIMNETEPVEDLADLVNYWTVPLTTTARGVTGTARLPLSVEEEEEDNGQVVAGYLEVYHNYQLVGDVMMIELVVTNTDTSRHRVGVRVALDTGFGGFSPADGNVVLLPDGATVNTEGVFPDPATPGVGLPDRWVAYDDLQDPLVAVKGVLDNTEIRQPGFAGTSAGPPHALEIGLWARLAGAGFNFIPNRGLLIAGQNWGTAVKWNERDLAPGASRRYVTYVGCGAAKADYNPPIAVMSFAPVRLHPVIGDDPSTPEVEPYHYTDEDGRSPFPVSVWVDNFGTTSLVGGTASIELPEGLTFIPLGQPRSRGFGTVLPNRLSNVEWSLNAAQARPGMATVHLVGPRSRVVDRAIQIPAVPVLPPRETAIGLEMISVPYQFDYNDAEHVFSSLAPLEGSELSALVRFDPSALTYRFFPHPFVTNVEPGLGYWLLNRAAETVVLPDDAQPLPPEAAVVVPLARGWNQIGNPFTLPVRLDALEVLTAEGAQLSLTEAVGRRLLQPVLFSYNPLTQAYEWEREIFAARLDPFLGYWLLIYDPLTLVVPPPSATIPLQTVSAQRVGASSTPGGWEAQVLVSGGSPTPAQAYFGVTPEAQDGLDRLDVAAPPPALGSGLQVSFVAPQGGAAKVVDLQADDGAEKIWHLQVSSAQPRSNLYLSWPDLGNLPEGLVPVLEDTATGARCYMRTTGRYRFDLAEGGTRLFRIMVRPKSEVGPMVSTLQARAAADGSYEFTYALSAPAQVEVTVRNIAGLVVKRLAPEGPADAGLNTLQWNGRADNGTRVPAGRYLCQITALAPETGQSSSLITAFEVSR